MIFVSVIRIVSVWFLVRQAPMVTQLTGLTGQMGAIAAAAPLTFLLDRLGWTRAFATVSSVGVLLLIAVVFVVKDSPYRNDEVVTIKLRALAQSVRTVWGNPGTRLGMWSHFTSQFSGTVFALLWGFPFLVRGLGLVRRCGGRAADGDDRLGGAERADARAAGGAAPALPLLDRDRGRPDHGLGLDRRAALAGCSPARSWSW